MNFSWTWRKKHRWTLLDSDKSSNADVEETLLDKPTKLFSEDAASLEEERSPPTSMKDQQSFWWVCLTIANAILFTMTAFWATGIARREESGCSMETSFYSPITESRNLPVREVKLNGTLFPPQTDVPWSRREPGDPVAESMWETFETFPTFPITRAQVVALGKDPEEAARYPNDFWGMGDDAYIASVDVQHKVHCLNELRKKAFADYHDEAPKNRTHSRLWWIHLRHCVDMLTQDLFCHADADLFLYKWTDTQLFPFPDFAINRRCRDINDVLAYRDQHAVDFAKYVNMSKPSDVVQVPNEPGYYEMFGFVASDMFPDGEGYPPLP